MPGPVLGADNSKKKGTAPSLTSSQETGQNYHNLAISAEIKNLVPQQRGEQLRSVTAFRLRLQRC